MGSAYYEAAPLLEDAIQLPQARLRTGKCSKMCVETIKSAERVAKDKASAFPQIRQEPSFPRSSSRLKSKVISRGREPKLGKALSKFTRPEPRGRTTSVLAPSTDISSRKRPT